MADFDLVRQQLKDSRAERDQSAAAIAALQQALKRNAARQGELNRVFDGENGRQVEERERLEAEGRRLEEELGRQRDVRGSAITREAVAVRDFGVFSDPRDGIARLDDATPILLMPVRLETRFKTVPVPGSRVPVPQLWVRIFPDDCWIDSFDPVLTEAEVTHAKTYWTSVWAAGGVESQERAAWSALATGHGSGRAAWIVQQYQPVNLADKPAKPRPEDVVLTIGTEAPLSPAEATAAGAFWRTVWLAEGDAAKIGAASTQLELAVGAARAGEIATTFVPANFGTPAAAGATKNGVNLTVAFVVFPIVATRQAAWSQAPKATILPDRFVLIGYETEGDPNPLIAVGSAVPSPLLAGPDPAAAEADQLRHDAKGNVVVPDELAWMTDFDRAVGVGMGMRIPLSPTQASRGFKRVLVVGLRLHAGEQTAKTELETLLLHHSMSRTGLAIVPQGMPTNNTEAVSSGAGRRLDDPDDSFDDLKAPLFTVESGWLDKRDGQWLAEVLGIDPALLAHTHHAGATDQRAARAMNTVLWPATLGYWMESMMAPVFTPDGVEHTRDFFARYVVPGGIAPAIRIGSQPYGILPATTLSRMPWLDQPQRDNPAVLAGGTADPLLAYLRQLYPILRAIDADFRGLSAKVPFVGKSGDPHAMLLEIVGLHPGSVEWSQRYAESLETLFNRLNLQGFATAQGFVASRRREAAADKLRGLGYAGQKDPPILDLIFNGKHNQLKGGVIDDAPLSETEAIRPSTTDGRNYIQWLIDASGISLDALYAQQGFTNDKEPGALLYLFLRHALQLGYHDVGIRLHENAGLYDASAVQRARIDDPFLHVRDNTRVSESRYQPLYAVAPQITGGGTLAVHEFIGSQIATLGLARYLRDQRGALERLKNEPTARLERAFADHVDACAYRLDAWLLGIVNYQLGLMRNLHDGSAVPARQGIHLGGYAWLEDLAPENKVLTPVSLTDPTLVAEFADPADPPLLRDNTSQGYVHAPSLNHAVAAAVLRNGFISNASRANRQTMAVNLTSERVRVALGMIEGIRAGQSLSDLLGYQFERGLHDRHGLAEVDKFIYKLRRAFPIRADRLNSTRPPEGASIESIEARNVLDGLALVQHIKATNNAVYPFGKPRLPKPSVDEARAIKAEVDRLLESHDAVADLALSEGVYQAVMGNYDRVASTYDAYARGDFPPEPDVIRTPLSGIGLTHRVGLHLASGVDPNVSPVPGVPAVPMTPRAQGEPALNKWLAGMLPALQQIGCMVSFRAASGGLKTREVTLRDLTLQPADLLVLVGDDTRQAMTELDDRIVRHAFLNFGPRPDVTPSIEYLGKDTAAFSVFETLPLIRNLRTLITKSRPLRLTDLTMMNEAESKQDQQPFVDRARVDLVEAAMAALGTDLAAFKGTVDALLADPVANRAGLIAAADANVTKIVELLARAATFGIAQAGWGFAYDFKRRTYTAILDQCAARVRRWDGKLAEFAARLADVAGATTDEARFDFCAQAERAISTIVTTPLPATPGLYLADLTGPRRLAFTGKRSALDAVKNTARTGIALLLADVQALLPITDFDVEPFSLTAHEDEMIRFAEDVSRIAAVAVTEVTGRLAAAAEHFRAHDDTAIASEQVSALERAAKAILGEDFKIVPQFVLPSARGDELENAWNATRSRAPFNFLTHPPDPTRDPLDFPLDTWLYGVARVREKMRAWEQTVLFSGALGQPEPELEALQLPFIPGDAWLGLEFPPDQKLDIDRLLYTAHFSAAFSKSVAQCGLLLDEWTEIIPTSSVDTGLTFHHDRPNCEAPQAMLLVTPSEFRGEWQWQDLLGALNETLDFAKRRAVEPKHIDDSAYGPYLPATAIATQAMQLTIALELGLNNKIAVRN